MKRVLFICVGNSCRSQMAEGFARAIGDGRWEVESAGLMPAAAISPLTRQVMEEKGISLEGQYPKPLEWIDAERFDLLVNMSGGELPPELARRETRWEVEDPIGQPVRTYRKVRDQIEGLVRALLEQVEAERGV